MIFSINGPIISNFSEVQHSHLLIEHNGALGVGRLTGHKLFMARSNREVFKAAQFSGHLTVRPAHIPNQFAAQGVGRSSTIATP